jgi:hypothetical protein
MSPQGEIPFTYPISYAMPVLYSCPGNRRKRRVALGWGPIKDRTDVHSTPVDPEEVLDGKKVGIPLTSHKTG